MFLCSLLSKSLILRMLVSGFQYLSVCVRTWLCICVIFFQDKSQVSTLVLAAHSWYIDCHHCWEIFQWKMVPDYNNIENRNDRTEAHVVLKEGLCELNALHISYLSLNSPQNICLAAFCFFLTQVTKSKWTVRYNQVK